MIVVSTDYICACCGERAIEIQDADTHDVTWCQSCGTLSTPRNVQVHTLLIQRGEMKPSRPDLAWTTYLGKPAAPQ